MLRLYFLPSTYTQGSTVRSCSSFHTGAKHALRKSYSSGPLTEANVWLPKSVNMYMYLELGLQCICLPAADRTFSASPGNENVRKTIVDDAILAPSPESLTVTCVDCGSSISSSYKNRVHYKYKHVDKHTCILTRMLSVLVIIFLTATPLMVLED